MIILLNNLVICIIQLIAMENNYPQMPGYQVEEFLLVLSPHEELRYRIARIQEEFAGKFKMPHARYLKPHIPLVRFTTWSMMEEKIRQRLQAITMGIPPFKVELKDYGSLPSHSIFINVISKVPIQHIVTQLKEMQRLMKMNQENKPHFLDEPHITIARQLKPWQYEQGWLEYSHRHFTGRFIAESLLLLKRPASARSTFQIAGRFELQNLPVTTRQGNLFV
jgi:2'-5' RNA ligase